VIIENGEEQNKVKWMHWQTKAKIMKTCALLPAGGYLQVYPEDVWQIEGGSDVPDSCAD